MLPSTASLRFFYFKMRRGLFFVAVGLVGSSLSALAADPLGPGAGPWIVESGEAHGLDSAALAAMGESVFKVHVRDCLVVIKDGALVYEKYSTARYNRTGHQGFSQTKSLGALLMGWASDQAEQGRGGVDIDADTAAYGVKSPRPYPVTSRQIMSQALDGADGPGQAWAYDAIGTRWINVLTRVFAAATGRKPSDVFREAFALPLGLSEQFSWKSADSAWDAGSVGTCRDYARFGQLLLNGGRWPGVAAPNASVASAVASAAPQQIVSSAYVAQMSAPQTHYAPYANYSNPCYGLLTWLNTNPGSDRGSAQYPGVCKMWPQKTWFPSGSGSNVYLLAGLLGQETMVIPDHNMVVVSMGDSADDYPLERAMYEGVCTLFPGECHD